VGGLSAVFNVSYLYDVITAVVIGGVSFFGGIGSIGAVVLGVLILGVLKNAMIIMNMPHYTQNAVGGVFLIIAIGFDSYLQKLNGK
jgi:ribose/xylose/arabinose/galactoside ABC-type transport system permease subunit